MIWNVVGARPPCSPCLHPDDWDLQLESKSKKDFGKCAIQDCRGNKYGDPRPTEFRTKLNFILVICLNKIDIAELIAQRFSSKFKSDS